MIKHGQCPFEQVVPDAYRAEIPKDISFNLTGFLNEIPFGWLLPNLFNLIWNKLRSNPVGESTGHDIWPLNETLEAHIEERKEEEGLEEEGENFCETIPADILVKHAVHLFTMVTKAT